jgi:hypothetical protein
MIQVRLQGEHTVSTTHRRFAEITTAPLSMSKAAFAEVQKKLVNTQKQVSTTSVVCKKNPATSVVCAAFFFFADKVFVTMLQYRHLMGQQQMQRREAVSQNLTVGELEKVEDGVPVYKSYGQSAVPVSVLAVRDRRWC